VSHDLWTPLAGLQLSITGLLDPKIQWKEEQVMECLQLASDEVDQLTARVRNLLEMARLESDTQYSQKEPCDLADIVGSALERLRPLLKDRRVDAVFPSGPLMIECRHAQFEMVVMNLLENATKYSPPASPLNVRGELRGDDIYFSLRDYGPGVAAEESERIFDKFYRGKPSRHLGGSGLGLAICKNVVEAHGGIIGVMNAPGGGAEFWFSVPALEPMKRFGRWTTQVAS
jgi:two-component system sensor histidine kinase KdpD